MNDPAVFALASRCARLALGGVRREYPNKLDHVMGGAADVRGPRALHPAFYGCYDWHSAVHGHWLLARVLRRWEAGGDPARAIPEAADAIAVLDEHLTPANIGAEVEYLRRPLSRAFERTYGWAWALKLHEELGRGAGLGQEPRSSGIGDALGAKFRVWAEAVRPLAEAIVEKYEDYLPRLTYPIRTGVHANTAFGLLLAWDWAAWAGRDEFRGLIEASAQRFFGHDRDCPAAYEPSGSDFFSPSLMEAALVARCLGGGAGRYSAWLRGFLPGADRAEPGVLFEPAVVSDRSDPQIVHLDGLNLSRAWCMRIVASALDSGTVGAAWEGAARARLLEAAARHRAASLPHVASGAYEGEHWLGTFAMLAVDGA